MDVLIAVHHLVAPHHPGAALTVGRKYAHVTLPMYALLLVGIGHYLGLAWAPPDREMGDVQRIMYVARAGGVDRAAGAHAQLRLLGGVPVQAELEDGLAGRGLRRGGPAVRHGGRAAGRHLGPAHLGRVLDWDPRLTTAAIMLVAYTGYMALRRFVEDPEKRAVWSAVVGIIAAVDVPIIWFSVKWWRSLHQQQSSPKTVGPGHCTCRCACSAYGFLAFADLLPDAALPDRPGRAQRRGGAARGAAHRQHAGQPRAGAA